MECSPVTCHHQDVIVRVPVQTYVTALKRRSHSYSWQVDTFADFDQIFNFFHPDTVCKSFSGSTTCLRCVSTTAAVTLAVLFTLGKEDEGVKGSNQAGWEHLCCRANQKCTRRGEEKLLKTPGEMEDFGFHVSQVILNSNDQPATRTGAPYPVPFGWGWSKEGGEHPALPIVSLESVPAGNVGLLPPAPESHAEKHQAEAASHCSWLGGSLCHRGAYGAN